MIEKQIYDELNELRRTTLKKMRIIFTILYSISISISIYLMSLIANMGDEADGRLFILIIGGNISIYPLVKPIILKNYRKTFKTLFVPKVMQAFGNDIHYEQGGLELDAITKTSIFNSKITTYKSEDTIKGKVSDVNFKSCDVKMGYYVSSGKHRRYVKVCHGQWYIFDFNKNFSSSTIIRELNDSIFSGDGIGRPYGYEPIKMENEAFNQKFKLYSNNQHEAFYILTPHFMEKLMYLEERYNGRIFMAFYYNEFHLGIDNDYDLFEPPLYNPINESTFTSQLNDLKVISTIIEELKLNIKIFKD